MTESDPNSDMSCTFAAMHGPDMLQLVRDPQLVCWY
jgi:hypothetical protein